MTVRAARSVLWLVAALALSYGAWTLTHSTLTIHETHYSPPLLPVTQATTYVSA